MILCKKRKQKPWTIWMFTVKVCSKCQFRMFAIFICLKASMISLSSHSPMRIPIYLFQNKVRWKWVFINLFSRHPASSLELNNFHFFFFFNIKAIIGLIQLHLPVVSNSLSEFGRAPPLFHHIFFSMTEKAYPDNNWIMCGFHNCFKVEGAKPLTRGNDPFSW